MYGHFSGYFGGPGRYCHQHYVGCTTTSSSQLNNTPEAKCSCVASRNALKCHIITLRSAYGLQSHVEPFGHLTLEPCEIVQEMETSIFCVRRCARRLILPQGAYWGDFKAFPNLKQSKDLPIFVASAECVLPLSFISLSLMLSPWASSLPGNYAVFSNPRAPNA